MKIKLFLLTLLAFAVISCDKPQGTAAETGEAKAVDTTQTTASAAATTAEIDPAASSIAWIGTKLSGKHNGSLKIKSGSFKLEGNELKGGEFVLDMASIEVLDLKGEMKAKLEGHLKDSEFFEAKKFPEGKFTITSVTAAAQGDSVSHKVEGNLELKGISKGVSFPAKIEVADGKVKATTKSILIDRTEWGIVYTGKKDDLIRNEIALQLNVVSK